ncbi:MAG: hypothetical protein E5V85_04490 [Mesorhizobium sp.]|nr:MAG: hypothetical protein E5V85_04490 [Mesorhizobium sp.]
MAPGKAGGLWATIRDNPSRPVEKTNWSDKLNETHNWLKHHDKPGETRALASFEACLFILRAMDK